MVLAMDEVISMVKCLMNGVQIDDEQLALEAIHRVGADSNYISDEHTLKHFREVWYPRFLDRRDFATWSVDGKNMIDRLNAKVLDLLATHKPAELPVEKAQRVRKIIEQAEARAAEGKAK
jgi:trimethylamine--corrinoid protein Co-methyltransferase